MCRRPLMADTVEKVFWGRRTKFSRAADAFCARRCEGPRRISEKRPRTFASALRRIPTVELSKKQHLRDFWGVRFSSFSTQSAPSGHSAACEWLAARSEPYEAASRIMV